jgi:LPS export ABC transporter protein LptC
MLGGVKYLKLYLPASFICLLLLSACENDLNKVKAIAAADSTKAVDRTTGLEVIFSDSAKVKLKLTAPLSLDYKGKKSYTLMPKGVKVVFYNPKLEVIGTITADTGIRREKLIEFHKNVVATNPEGSVFRSEQLIWNQDKKQIYSNKSIKMTKLGGDVLNGSSFVSDEKLLHPVFQNSTGMIHVNENMTQ